MTVVGEMDDKIVTVGSRVVTAVVVIVEKIVEIGGVLMTVKVDGGSVIVDAIVAN